MINVSKYISIPYKDKGQSFDGCDCLGLVRLVLKEEFAKELPRFEYQSADNTMINERLINVNLPTIQAEKVDKPIPGDIVVMNGHIGIFVNPGSVLHTTRGIGTCCEPIDRPRLRGRIKGFYRVA